MAATAIKRSELVLIEEHRKSYDEWWNTFNESLKKLKIDTNLPEMIKDPYRFSELIGRRDKELRREYGKVARELNHHFVEKNELPERITGRKELDQLFGYLGKEFGMDLDKIHAIPSLLPTQFWATSPIVRSILTYKRGTSTIAAADTMVHEFDHMSIPFAKFGWDASTLGIVISMFIPPLSIPGSQQTRRYFEGRACFAESKLLESNSDELKAYGAWGLLYRTATPMQSKSAFTHRSDAIRVFYANNFRNYYNLQEKIGEENLKDFEKCAVRKV